MKTIFATIALVAFAGAAHAGADSFNWEIHGCDPAHAKEVRSERTGELLYLNNWTCPPAPGGGASEVEEDDDGKKGKRRGGKRRGGDQSAGGFPGVGWGVGGNPRNRTPGEHPQG